MFSLNQGHYLEEYLKNAQSYIFINNEQDTENKLSMAVCGATSWMDD